ncbi:peptide-methionine (R)-S-oxide reductase MsrB [Hyphomonadaceae bacterium ML37]|nr:peptide-methionine (R)-S-oxide reductase MsrB [Hyphomonadaceae bacterium ML37]
MARLSKDEIARLRADLPPEVDVIAFHEGTEPPGCSPLNAEKRDGIYHCAVCGEALFSSAAKYESGSGWPSFFAPLSAEAVGTKRDFKLILPRTEFHCANCGAHGGHVFNDGPPPTGQRWCANGRVLDFRPAPEE